MNYSDNVSDNVDIDRRCIAQTIVQLSQIKDGIQRLKVELEELSIRLESSSMICKDLVAKLGDEDEIG